MLVLSRRKNQSIIIGNNIEIVVVDVGKNKVRLGIIAPIDINVLRKELSLKTEQIENNEAVYTI